MTLKNILPVSTLMQASPQKTLEAILRRVQLLFALLAVSAVTSQVILQLWPKHNQKLYVKLNAFIVSTVTVWLGCNSGTSFQTSGSDGETFSTFVFLVFLNCETAVMWLCHRLIQERENTGTLHHSRSTCALVSASTERRNRCTSCWHRHTVIQPTRRVP